MQLAYEKLKGLDRDRLIATIEPVLVAHGVDAVELVWQSEPRGWVLRLTVERPGTTEPGAGITLDLCAEISRDLSTALDVADAIAGKYRLEVGSPGLERALYSAVDYQRFSGHVAKLKLSEPVEGTKVLRGTLRGLDDNGRVVLDTDQGERHIEPAWISSGRLVFEWQRAQGDHADRHDRRRARSGRSTDRSR